MLLKACGAHRCIFAVVIVAPSAAKKGDSRCRSCAKAWRGAFLCFGFNKKGRSKIFNKKRMPSKRGGAIFCCLPKQHLQRESPKAKSLAIFSGSTFDKASPNSPFGGDFFDKACFFSQMPSFEVTFWGGWKFGCLTQPKKGPWNKSLNFIFPTKYVIPKSLKVSHWLSKLLLFLVRCY